MDALCRRKQAARRGLLPGRFRERMVGVSSRLAVLVLYLQYPCLILLWYAMRACCLWKLSTPSANPRAKTLEEDMPRHAQLGPSAGCVTGNDVHNTVIPATHTVVFGHMIRVSKQDVGCRAKENGTRVQALVGRRKQAQAGARGLPWQDRVIP